ncbi:hypothetical protein chiPu_0001766 [Chiloscyllium punctatum]|uniref:Uncharacterized protein n=1 Tax=Chiloscyllium punctatum TaxID=137246 RepID=A0A401RYZ4_CHIPU|nr:hypothetical protein [Chiloscyllium punctatum]
MPKLSQETWVHIPSSLECVPDNFDLQLTVWEEKEQDEQWEEYEKKKENLAARHLADRLIWSASSKSVSHFIYKQSCSSM